MTARHATEQEIQLFVLERENLLKGSLEHILSCPDCIQQAEEYRMIFQTVSSLPRPQLDPALSGQVWRQARAENTTGVARRVPGVIVLGLPALLAIAVPVIIYRNFLFRVAGTMSVTFFVIAGSAVLTLLVFQGMDTWRQYRKKLDTLNFY